MSSKFKMVFKSSASGDKRKREDAPKKHRGAEFLEGSSRGVVMKLTSLDVQSLVNDVDSRVVIRPLGEELEVFSSQQTVYVETGVEEDRIGSLERKLTELEGKFTRFCEDSQKEVQSLKKQVERSEERLDVCELFLHQGMSVALRAFCDFVLATFFQACGMEAAGFKERAAWLANCDAGEAFVTANPVTIRIFGGEKRIGRKEFYLIKSLRHASSQLSSGVRHSATSLEVAIALEREGTSVFAGGFKNICALFEVLFDVSFKKMVKDWKEGNLKEEFKKQFKAPSPPDV